jgi:RNA-directed DNA polymerase
MSAQAQTSVSGSNLLVDSAPRSIARPYCPDVEHRVFPGMPVGNMGATKPPTAALEPIVEPIFHDDSYGYRPDRSALDAVEAARKRCWK